MLPSDSSANPQPITGSVPSNAPSFAVGPSVNPQSSSSETFVDRRSANHLTPGSTERRQFGNSHTGLSESGRELALAIDQYKVEHHRRYLTCDEMLEVITELGYTKSAT